MAYAYQKASSSVLATDADGKGCGRVADQQLVEVERAVEIVRRQGRGSRRQQSTPSAARPASCAARRRGTR